MRIEFRDAFRRKLGRVVLDDDARPTRVDIQSGGKAGREVFLTWDSAVDDAGQLRRCVACGCGDLFSEKAFPQITGVIVVLAFAGAIVGALNLANTAVLLGMAVVLVLDASIFLFSRRRLVCYRCRSSYHQLPIARYHQAWDRGTAERYPAPARTPDDDTTETLATEPRR